MSLLRATALRPLRGYSVEPSELARQLEAFERSVAAETTRLQSSLLPRLRVRDVARGNVAARAWDAVRLDTSGDALTLLLPALTGADAGSLVVCAVVDATNGVTVRSAAQALIQGEASLALESVGLVWFMWDGSAWWATGTAEEPEVTSVAVRLAANFTKTSDTALADVPGLGFAIAANETWAVTWELYATMVLTTGPKIAVTVPAGATLKLFGKSIGGGSNAAIATTTVSGTGVNLSPGSASSGVVSVHATIANGATAGTVQLQAAQQTSNGTPLNINAGSFMQAQREG